MTNFEHIHSLSQEEFASWLGATIARTVEVEDFNKWVIYRDECKRWAREYLAKEKGAK